MQDLIQKHHLLRDRRLRMVLGPCLTPCVQVDEFLIQLGRECMLVLDLVLSRVITSKNLLESSREARCRFAAFEVCAGPSGLFGFH